jgi:(1->4)-alpha-D-glucan 1-alpha-D-glucosylmutase
MSDRPGSTYRLQLQPDFGFSRAAGVAGYLASLGVTHVYLSPVLQAASGSRHGYDVVDHGAISAELGGEGGLRAMVAVFREHDLGVIADVVPNHMSIAPPQWQNRQFWSVLRDGPQSSCAHWFDIDWAARDGRLLLPVLAGPPAACAADLVVDHGGEPAAGGDEPVLRYFEHVLPLRPGTAQLPLADLLAAQYYELADWRTAPAGLNWRRFFDITSLIAVQVQHDDVFAATHGLLLGLAAEGLIDGLRVDHPDGLADPRGYLRRLETATGGGWVVTEKILSGDERLPADWPCAGTTGYDALAMTGGLFADAAGEPALTAAYTELTGGPEAFAPVAQAAKAESAAGSLAAEVARLARVASRSGDPVLEAAEPAALRIVAAELVASMEAYRAYVVPGEPPPAASVAQVTAAGQRARERLPARLHKTLDALAALVLLPAGPPAAAELAVRFQQTCGPVLAKGVEDTAFYRWSRLTALNEVGGDPGRLGVSPADFHVFAARLARDWPATMTTLSTHDTKRGEDVRARLTVLAERPAQWTAAARRWHELAAGLAGERELPEPDTEYLLWQTLVGAWPIDPARLTGYLRKAMREAKTRTSWASPDEGYEADVTALARAALADPELSGEIAAFVAGLEEDALAGSLGAKLVQLTMPGVPDVYQGCELGGFTLVDPDNRRPADFDRRRQLLAQIDRTPAGTAWDGGSLDRLKLLVTARALRLRRDNPGWFAGRYEALAATGTAAAHVVAFCRGGRAVTVATRLPGGLRGLGGWGDTALELPGDPAWSWRDVLTGAVHHPAGPLPAADITGRLPVALLVPEPLP